MYLHTVSIAHCNNSSLWEHVIQLFAVPIHSGSCSVYATARCTTPTVRRDRVVHCTLSSCLGRQADNPGSYVAPPLPPSHPTTPLLYRYSRARSQWTGSASMARLVCTPCAGRTTDETGSDATDDKAECTPHAALTECVAWPDGSASAVAGSNAIVDNEECTTTFCAANEHVVPTACVVCPAGSTSAGGDDASCNDSERCESTLSDARGRVLNNQSCAEGAAGGMSLATDDASKALYPAVDGCGAYYMQNDAGTAEDARK